MQLAFSQGEDSPAVGPVGIDRSTQGLFEKRSPHFFAGKKKSTQIGTKKLPKNICVYIYIYYIYIYIHMYTYIYIHTIYNFMYIYICIESS